MSAGDELIRALVYEGTSTISLCKLTSSVILPCPNCNDRMGAPPSTGPPTTADSKPSETF